LARGRDRSAAPRFFLPVSALKTWIRLGHIARGPPFRRVFADRKTVDVEGLTEKHVAGLVKRRRPPESAAICRWATRKLFAGHSLRAGLASPAEVDERYVQEQFGQASAEIIRKCDYSPPLYGAMIVKLDSWFVSSSPGSAN
jgi:hypothetical protein